MHRSSPYHLPRDEFIAAAIVLSDFFEKLGAGVITVPIREGVGENMNGVTLVQLSNERNQLGVDRTIGKEVNNLRPELECRLKRNSEV